MSKKETWEERILQRREKMGPCNQTIISGRLILRRYEMKEQKKIQKIVVNSPYNFLQYLGLVCRWAMRKYGISRPDLEFLLYLHPVGVFNQRQFRDVEKMYGIIIFMRFKSFVDKGYITFHSQYKKHPSGKGRAIKLYTLSHASTSMINAMHRRLLFLEKMPSSYVSRSMMKKDPINYDALLEEFNKKVVEKEIKNNT